MCQLELWKCLSFWLFIFIERALLDFRQIFIISHLTHRQKGKCETFLKLYIDSNILNHISTEVSLSVFSQALLSSGPWWALVMQRFWKACSVDGSRNFFKAAEAHSAGSDAGVYWPYQDNHITAATYWLQLWDVWVHMWEHGCRRTSAVWCFEGCTALLGCLSDPEFNSQIISLYILNEAS